MTFKQSPPGFRNVEGPLVKVVQQALTDQGFPPQGGADGQWGGHTAAALKAWQQAKGLAVTGVVDDATWAGLINNPVPTVSQRALQLTGVWEGTGYGGANGNFDGEGITWGVVGFTWKNGELQGILTEIRTQFPAIFSAAFGANEAEIVDILAQPRAAQMTWARGISINGGNNIAQPWSDAFQALGDTSDVQAIENQHAQHYWNAGLQFAQDFGLQSDSGLALCFDIAVQNTVTDDMLAEIQNRLTPGMAENDRMVIIAHVVADHANPDYYTDVLTRKMTFATGQGKVHGDLFDITCWGVA
jgi:hypothetical protein